MEDVASAVAADPRVQGRLLFVVTRSLNRNAVVYCLDDAGDVEAFWIMYEKPNAPTEELTLIEKNTAYGFAWDRPRMRVTSIKDRELKVEGANAVTRVGDCARARIFHVHVTMGSGLLPRPTHIDLHGVAEDGALHSERISA